MAQDRDTWLPFTRHETKEIRAAMANQPGEAPPCPDCGEPLQVQGPRRKAYDVRCKKCRRNTIVPEELLDTSI